jgi:tetratricopeptide (TPR) repeat protein
MLAFIEQLAQHVARGSLLLIATARPELMDTAPDFGRNLANLTRMHLAPLTDGETVALVSGVLGTTAAVPEALRDSLVSRAEGNPLYVGEFLRLLRDRQLLVRQGDGWQLLPGAELPVPGSVQALIAARLDLLPGQRKAILADAAVVGKVFWAGAVARLGDRPLDAVVEALDELTRRDLVRPVPSSSMGGDAEYAFWHVLTRDVAYAQLPRASRADRHAAVAGWLEGKAGQRLEDIADVLAHHYATAFELARATGDAEQAGRLRDPAVRFLILAGERAADLDSTSVITAFERAVELATPDHPARGDALLGYADAALEVSRTTDAHRAAEEALGLFRVRNAPDRVALALDILGRVSSRRGDDDHAAALLDESLALLEQLTPGEDLIGALASKSTRETMAGRPQAGVEVADRAIALAQSQGLRARVAMQRRGLARLRLGDRDGLRDYREALAGALDAGEASFAAMFYLNLSLEIALIDGPAAALDVTREALAFARPRGFVDKVGRMTLNEVEFLAEVGELDEALAKAVELLEDAARGDDERFEMYAHIQWARIVIAKGEARRIVDSLDLIAASGRTARNPTTLLDALTTCATGRAALQQGAEVVELLTAIDRFPAVRVDDYYGARLPTMLRAALAVGDVALAERLVEGVAPRWPYAEHGVVAAGALLAEARGETARAAEQHAEAADRWRAFGLPPEQAFSLLGRGRCLLALDRAAEAEPAVREARELFDRMGALQGVRECDALVAGAAL